LPRFTGSSLQTLDDKGRFVVPARYRESLGVGFVLTIYPPDPCLALFDAEAWDRVCSALEAQPQKSGEYRNFVRYIFGNTQQVSCDAQGRLVVSPQLRTYAGLNREVQIVGALSHVEIWAPERLAAITPDQAQAMAFGTEIGLY
jgi:MraZ protein